MKRPTLVRQITCWECHGCGWKLLDPQLDLAAAVCLCGTGAGRWSVSQESVGYTWRRREDTGETLCQPSTNS